MDASPRSRLVRLAPLLLTVGLGACRSEPPKAAAPSTEAAPVEAAPPARNEQHLTMRASVPHPEDAEVRFDIAFCLDTTGSMAKLITVAKERVRAVSKFIEAGTPAPSVRFGVVAYRDLGADYVTRLYGLDPDVTQAEAALGELNASGGGDGPEHIVAGLRRAVDDLDWDPKAKLKFVFLVGDAPAHLDYGDESDIDSVLERAMASGIRIGAIPLGEMPEDGVLFFHRVASGTGGPVEGIMAEAMLEAAVESAIADAGRNVGVAYPTE